MNISSGEKLTRFIRFSNQFSQVKGEVRYRAIIPPKNSENLSVFQISLPTELSDSEVWKIGFDHVQRGGIPIKARAELFVRDVTACNLKVILDEPPPRHANITPFPADNRARQSIARKLASVSKLVVLPENT
ncbi:hypothetical protein C6497_02505 [Candidatus Poribacteria bacterium]|nr:MAG: hypothetical protein C6497_02505 [Candidatus Poribacteria bacterium]